MEQQRWRQRQSRFRVQWGRGKSTHVNHPCPNHSGLRNPGQDALEFIRRPGVDFTRGWSGAEKDGNHNFRSNPGRTRQDHNYLNRLRHLWATDPQRYQSEFQGTPTADDTTWNQYLDASTPHGLHARPGGGPPDYVLAQDYWRDPRPWGDGMGPGGPYMDHGERAKAALMKELFRVRR